MYCAVPPECCTVQLHLFISLMCCQENATISSQFLLNCKYFFLSSVQCLPAPNITCKDHLGVEKVFTGHEVGFYKPIACRNV